MKKMMTQIWTTILNINKKHMNLEHITLERLQEIEAERAQTQLDPKFHTWMRDLHVGRLSIDRSGIMRANQMMEDYSKLKNQLWE
jgi:hypothetical protein